MLAAHVTAVTVPKKAFVLKPVLFFREKNCDYVTEERSSMESFFSTQSLYSVL